MKKGHWLIFVALFVISAVIGVLGSKIEQHAEMQQDESRTASAKTLAESEKTAVVTLINSKREEIGTAELKQQADGVLIKLAARNLPPGVHGFHFHEKGLCEPPDFESAGGHFNPTKKSHGFDHPNGPHAGDLPNIEVKEDGTVKTEVTAGAVTLEKGKANSLLGKEGTSLMIHEKPDDYVSQPAGDAGARIACGVIKQ